MIGDAETRNAILAYLPLIEADRAEFSRFLGALIETAYRRRELVSEAVDYHPTYAEANVAYLQMSPVPMSVLQYLDMAVASNEVRMIYLRRMLAATESTAAVRARRDPVSPIE